MILAPRSIGSDIRPAARWAGAALTLAVLACLFVGPAVAHAEDAARPFPRLAVWWPSPATQPLSEIARNDWIALQKADADRIPAIRALNPSAFILAPTAARELNYNLANYADPLNVELRSASTDWMLTQVGSTLTGAIDAGATTIQVADVKKFAAGEMALVDHELVHIDSVGTSSLRVTRGQLDTPATHVSGARIASVVSHWRNSIAMDLSTGCPRRDVGDGNGPETWADWNVQRALCVLATGDWDGLLIDGYEAKVSWMVGENRSIDEARTDRQPTADDYAALDTAWNAGAIAYGNELRAAVGGKILVSNGNLRCFTLNGTVFEGYPYSGLASSAWHYVFVGPYDDLRPSYTEWMQFGTTPNLTLTQTYGARTDYRLMRFGLCSALLNDGYYSYAGSSDGHAAINGIWEYDEYDDAGVGRGYLGQPLGAKAQVGSAWRRDFQGGVALVNPTSSAVTIKLGGTFRRIKGGQAPSVNNGALATSVTLGSHDGLILLRVPSVALRTSVSRLASGARTVLAVTVAPCLPVQVRFYERKAGTTTWHTITTVSADASGGASVTRSPTVSTQYQAIVLGSRAASGIVKVSVRPLVTLSTSTASVSKRTYAKVRGTLSCPGRVAVWIQQLSSGKWRTVAKLWASAGRFSAKLFQRSRGHRTYRAYAPSSVSHLTAASGSVLITVR